MAEQVIALKENSIPEPKTESTKRYFVRLTVEERLQHFVFLACFVVLALTGLMLKIPEQTVLKVLGEAREPVFYYRGLLHRIAAVIIMLTSLYHLYYLVFRKHGRRWLLDILPRPGDLKDMLHTMFFYVGIRKAHPKFGRFSYKQKMEYWALIAGNTLMTATGLILWSEFLWDRFILDLATIVHGMEAVLACLAIMVWHLYEVHLRPQPFTKNNLWIDGVIDEGQMKEEHPLHYEQIMENPELRKIFTVEKTD